MTRQNQTQQRSWGDAVVSRWNEQAPGTARRKENTARQGVPVEDLKPFARFLLPKLQVFYETEEGQRAFQEWKKETMIKTLYCIE